MPAGSREAPAVPFAPSLAPLKSGAKPPSPAAPFQSGARTPASPALPAGGASPLAAPAPITSGAPSAVPLAGALPQPSSAAA